MKSIGDWTEYQNFSRRIQRSYCEDHTTFIDRVYQEIQEMILKNWYKIKQLSRGLKPQTYEIEDEDRS